MCSLCRGHCVSDKLEAVGVDTVAEVAVVENLRIWRIIPGSVPDSEMSMK